jgi:TolA-binding protein
MKKLSFALILLATAPSYADDISLGDMSARLDTLEKRLNGENASGEELASKADVDVLRNEVKYLTGKVEMLEHQLSMVQQGKGGVSNSAGSTFQEPSLTPTIGDEDDVAEVLKALEGSAPNGGKESPKEVERRKATEQAEKNAPTLTLEKGSSSAKYDEALEAFRHQDYEGAQGLFEEFIHHNPKDARVKDAKYWVLESQLHQAEQNSGNKDISKKVARNLAEYIRANKDSKKLSSAVFALGRALELQGDKKNACTAFNKAKTLSKTAKLEPDVAKSLDEHIKKCK